MHISLSTWTFRGRGFENERKCKTRNAQTTLCPRETALSKASFAAGVKIAREGVFFLACFLRRLCVNQPWKHVHYILPGRRVFSSTKRVKQQIYNTEVHFNSNGDARCQAFIPLAMCCVDLTTSQMCSKFSELVRGRQRISV